MLIREEKVPDEPAVFAIHTAAFPTSAEAELVDRLRAQARPLISLVAEIDGEVAGHIMFSPVTLLEHPELQIAGLGPMAVRPERQGRGIGSALVRGGLGRCRQAGFGAVVVLGHPDYYPRFGFVPAAPRGITCEYRVPAEAFMFRELAPRYLAGVAGVVRYHPAFDVL